jgi:hypothetical protein
MVTEATTLLIVRLGRQLQRRRPTTRPSSYPTGAR